MATPARQKLGQLGVVHQTIGIHSAFPSFIEVHSIHLSMASVVSFFELAVSFLASCFSFQVVSLLSEGRPLSFCVIEMLTGDCESDNDYIRAIRYLWSELKMRGFLLEKQCLDMKTTCFSFRPMRKWAFCVQLCSVFWSFQLLVSLCLTQSQRKTV